MVFTRRTGENEVTKKNQEDAGRVAVHERYSDTKKEGGRKATLSRAQQGGRSISAAPKKTEGGGRKMSCGGRGKGKKKGKRGERGRALRVEVP